MYLLRAPVEACFASTPLSRVRVFESFFPCVSFHHGAFALFEGHSTVPFTVVAAEGIW
jgi:hypothetical protein